MTPAEFLEAIKEGVEPVCVCGHSMRQHCLDDECCLWDPDDGEQGGACLSSGCDCCTYRPIRKQREVET